MQKVRDLFSKEKITTLVEKINIPELTLVGITNPVEPGATAALYEYGDFKESHHADTDHPSWLPTRSVLKSYVFETDLFKFRITEYKQFIFIYNVIMTAQNIRGRYDIHGPFCAIRSASYPEINLIDNDIAVYLDGLDTYYKRWGYDRSRVKLATIRKKIKQTLEDNGLKYTIKLEKIPVEITVQRREQ